MRDDVDEKALAATGCVAEAVALDPRTGDPVLDDFEPVTYRRLVDYDPKVLPVLLGKLVKTEALRVDPSTPLVDDRWDDEEAPPTLTLLHEDGDFGEAHDEG